jgi:hypothetical protein
MGDCDVAGTIAERTIPAGVDHLCSDILV